MYNYDDEYEFQVEIDGVNYGMDTLTRVTIKQPLFDKFDVGLACSAQMTVSYYVIHGIEPSRGAVIIPRYRIKGSTNAWSPLGKFYIDLRTEKSGKKTLICFDSMMKADVPFLSEGDPGEWPRTMAQVAQEIARRMGVTIDPRTKISDAYLIDYPNEDTMRTLLSYIAAAHCGNWIMTSHDQLLLVPLAVEMPAETYYLVDEHGNALLFGEDRILV